MSRRRRCCGIMVCHLAFSVLPAACCSNTLAGRMMGFQVPTSYSCASFDLLLLRVHVMYVSHNGESQASSSFVREDRGGKLSPVPWRQSVLSCRLSSRDCFHLALDPHCSRIALLSLVYRVAKWTIDVTRKRCDHRNCVSIELYVIPLLSSYTNSLRPFTICLNGV